MLFHMTNYVALGLQEEHDQKQNILAQIIFVYTNCVSSSFPYFS